MSNRYQSSRTSRTLPCQNKTIPSLQIIRRLRFFSSLDRAGKILLCEAFGLSLFIAVSFKIAGVATTQSRLRAWSERASRSGQPRAANSVVRQALRAQRMVRRATGLGAGCLARSFTLWALLRRRGIEAELRVGYRKRDGTIEGHAWLEYEGAPINETAGVVETYILASHPTGFDMLQ